MNERPRQQGQWLLDTPGAVLDIIRQNPLGLTKTEVSQAAGLSRTAAASRVDLLCEAGYLERRLQPSGVRGRPSERFTIARGRGFILVADTGATAMRVALCDAAGDVLEEEFIRSDVAEGPETVLGRAESTFARFLHGRGIRREAVQAISISVPGPVDHSTGRVVSPPIMPGWHDYPIPSFFAQYQCPVVVEKDTNAMAYGEKMAVHPTVENMVFVKIGTGIGTGLLIHGDLYRGVDGAAGDIGHTIWTLGDRSADEPACRCGNFGCIETQAAGWAIAKGLTAAGIRAESVDDVVAAVRIGDRVALSLVRDAGHALGVALAGLVNFVNPSLIVFGGQLAALDDIILATARQAIYHRSLPLATRNLQILSSGIPNPGVVGLAHLAVKRVFSAAAVDAEFA